ncbi:MAG: translocation/assembly module TamB [Candidatus Amulumruptor caecigallinarius]|nr:translocation/assembly module TamB [Candidatus Amulumruptor caecigallinarius]MCM1397378.1 translocation/assembly module TamB [Candidatus Amulumruptor caecigallinarius]MCM1454746.1 translocation/assembly module TamB [bacterium]
MKWLYKTLRTLIVCIPALIIGVPVLLYVVLSLPPVQNAIGHRAEVELGKLLGVNVNIGRVDIEPFNIVTLSRVTVADSAGMAHGPIAVIDRLGAGIDIMATLRKRALVVTYVEIMGMDAHLWRLTEDSPLNIQPIIDALKPKDRNKPPTRFDLRFNSVVIRTSAVTYDVLSAPTPEPGRFDPRHIAIHDLRADIHLPKIANDDYTVDIRRLRLAERSGLQLEVTGSVHADNQRIAAEGLVVKLGTSRLLIAPTAVTIKSLKSVGNDLRTAHLNLKVLEGSRLNAADFSPFIPALARSEASVELTARVTGTLDALRLESLDASGSGVRLTASGSLDGLTQGREALSARLDNFAVRVDAPQLQRHLAEAMQLPPRVVTIMNDAGVAEMQLAGSYSAGAAEATGNLRSALADVNFEARATGDIPAGKIRAEGRVEVPQADLTAALPASARLGSFSITAEGAAGIASGRLTDFDVTADVTRAYWNNYEWEEVTATATLDGHKLTADVKSADPGARCDVHAEAQTDGTFRSFADMSGTLSVSDFALSRLPVGEPWSKRRLTVDGEWSLSSLRPDEMLGELVLTGLTLAGDEMTNTLGDIRADIDCTASPMEINLTSRVAEMRATGTFDFKHLGRDVTTLLADAAPSLFPAVTAPAGKEAEKSSLSPGVNNFSVELTVNDTRPLDGLVKLPVSVVHPVELGATLNSPGHYMAVTLDAPYLLQKDKLIENTALNIGIDGGRDRSGLYFTTVYPAKKGPVSLTLDGQGHSDEITLNTTWDMTGAQAMSGTLSLTASAARTDEGLLTGHVAINPTSMKIGGTEWSIGSSDIDIAEGRAEMSRWLLSHGEQYIALGGTLSAAETDSAYIDLADVDLDYVFDTLNIPNVDFGGHATGHFTVRQALSKAPVAWTDALAVEGLSYNNCVFGNAVIASAWDNVDQGITLDADIQRPEGGWSTVKGVIYPVKNGGGLDLSFGCDRTPVGFLQPFMSAFCSKVTGLVCGHARLFGSFSDLDLEGEAFAQDLRVTLPFTNTTYSATDSVKFTPGSIVLPDMTLLDSEGHAAKFTGWLRHRAFHDPVFEFVLHDAHDFLAYNIAETDTQPWYGRIYVDGSASITGRPGVVNIDVNASTAPKSTFGFVLSDTRSAGEYTFITFRDREGGTKVEGAELEGNIRYAPEAVKAAGAKAREAAAETPTAFNMQINVDANPNVAVTLVMDPVAGDRIRATGSGNLRMTYASRTDEMAIFGTYTIDRGLYNFTLQDIIVKDFTIESGSAITFHGNPYAAQLAITAAYQTTANLTDLDESFKDDHDLARTSVPVRALLKVSGDMRQPDLAFDLDFPTLTSDIDRKVRSLVNTEEMLNRQVMYLLALNRFYTPDYNTGASTHNNEIASLATNTLTSRLGSLLGTIDDNWSFAPSIRSEAGDFSDTEVDLALSSHLLNNRLLINGNLGYRDKSLNTSSFIGDFDIEYILNRRGTIRLKAYNRFNDQTFYGRNALTTQGAGVVFKLDFDNFDSWLRPFRRKKKAEADAPADTVAAPEVTPVPKEQ